MSKGRDTAELREASCNAAKRILAEIHRRPLEMVTPGMLVEWFKDLANFGGLPPSDKAWEAAMRTLASEHASEATKTRILELLAGMAAPAAIAPPDEA